MGIKKIVNLQFTLDMQADNIQSVELLSEMGFEVHTIVHRQSHRKHMNVHSLEFVKEFPGLDSFSILNRLSLRLLELVREKGIDLIYACTQRYGEALLASKLMNVPVILDIRNPFMIQAYDFHQKRDLNILKQRIRKIRYTQEKFLMNSATHILTLSEGIKRWCEDFLGVDRSKVTCIPPFVNTDKFSPNAPGTLDEEKYLTGNPIFSYIGEINEGRGIHKLIPSLAKLKESYPFFKFYIVGQIQRFSSYFNKLCRIIKNNDLRKNIIFTGLVPFEKIPFIINNSDVMVNVGQKTFTTEISPPIKVYEYMSCAKPVLSTRSFVENLIDDQVNGLLFDLDSEYDFFCKIKSLISDPTYMNRLGFSARELMINNHSLKSSKLKYRNVFDKLLMKNWGNYARS